MRSMLMGALIVTVLTTASSVHALSILDFGKSKKEKKEAADDSSGAASEHSAKLSLGESRGRANEPAKIDAILATLNQTLDENKKLKTQVESLEESTREMGLEGTLLRGQLRNIQSEAESLKSQEKTKIQELEADLKETQNKLEELRSETETSVAERKMAVKQAARVHAKNVKLERLLKTAILESERDEYIYLLKSYEGTANRSILELQKTKSENEALKANLASSYYNVGNMLYRSGDYKRALAQYKKAIELNPNDAWSHYNTALIYDYHLNDRARSLVHYKKYLNLRPVSEEAERIRERILDIELKKRVVPKRILKGDFNRYNHDLNKVSTL